MGIFDFFKGKKKEVNEIQDTDVVQNDTDETVHTTVDEDDTYIVIGEEDTIILNEDDVSLSNGDDTESEHTQSMDELFENIKENLKCMDEKCKKTIDLKDLEEVVKKHQEQSEKSITESEAIEKIVEEVTGTVEANVVKKITEEMTETIEADITEKVVDEIVQTIEADIIEEVVEIIEADIIETEVVEEVVEEIAEEIAVAIETENIEEVVKETDQTEESVKKVGFFGKIKTGIAKTREAIFSNVESVLNSFTTIDEDLFEELEEVLILSDIGVETSTYIIEQLRAKVKKEGIKEVSDINQALKEIIAELLEQNNDEFELKPPTVILVIGVNGVGKTTTIGKLANNFKKEGNTVMLAAADTFRAAAIDQLEVWAKRSNVPLIRQQENGDPGAVVYDACQSAKSKNIDVLLVDTAGRLQNKKNLMDELGKITRIINREHSNANIEVFLVLDSTTGQNALQQAKVFNEVANVTGLVLTKLDGTAKGGVIVAIKHELDIPVRYVGLGEKIDDLEKFDSEQFAKALLNL